MGDDRGPRPDPRPVTRAARAPRAPRGPRAVGRRLLGALGLRPCAAFALVAALVVPASLVACASPGPAPAATPGVGVTATPGPSGLAAIPAAGDGVTVTLGVFSGLPDPAWRLSRTEAAELRMLVDALPVVRAEPPSGGLGYHGFAIADAGAGPGSPPLVAYHGWIAAAGEGPREARRDADGSVERFLLETGRRVVDPAVLRLVDEEFATLFGPPSAAPPRAAPPSESVPPY